MLEANDSTVDGRVACDPRQVTDYGVPPRGATDPSQVLGLPVGGLHRKTATSGRESDTL